MPLPTVRAPRSTPLFTSAQESETSRHTLGILNDQLSYGHGPSAFLQQTVRDLQKLLDPNDLTR